MQEFLPGSYIIKVDPSPALDGVTHAGTTLVAFDMNLNTSTKVPDDVIYRLTKALYENKQELAQTFPPLGLFDPKNMAKPQIGIEFHPGAIKFYQEAGIWQARAGEKGAPAKAEPARKGDGKKK
jgi:TRAP-type uncharacterized transport system substrate-binding protein